MPRHPAAVCQFLDSRSRQNRVRCNRREFRVGNAFPVERGIFDASHASYSGCQIACPIHPAAFRHSGGGRNPGCYSSCQNFSPVGPADLGASERRSNGSALSEVREPPGSAAIQSDTIFGYCYKRCILSNPPWPPAFAGVTKRLTLLSAP